jgi:RNA polymerase sigma factor (sigma-70 family)
MIANFKAELGAFENLFAPGCRERILFFYGESGFGKTTLLQRCLDSLPEAFPLVEFQVRNTAVDVAEILSRTVSCLGWADFPRYKAKIEEMQGGNKIEIENVSLVGQHNQLNAIIRSDNPRQLLDTWFDDLANLGRMLLIVFDTYEHASAEVQNWIEGPFLFRVARMSTVRVLIAGRMVPDTQTIDWRRCCNAHHLKGIPEAEHWLPVVQSLNRRIPKPEITWLDGLCRGLQGRPHAIMQYIESLPLREGPVDVGTDEERERLVLQIRLESLPSSEREALRTAAVPHWFDLPFLAALLNEPLEPCRVRIERLARLSMVEPCPGRGHNVHERSRFLLLEDIEQGDPSRFLDLSRRAALHCGRRAAEDPMWHIEKIFHLLIAEPALGLEAFLEATKRWQGSTERSYDLLDALTRMVREHREAGRLSDQARGWSFYWDGRLDQIYFRDAAAESHLLQAQALAGEDLLLDAESALALGRFHPLDEASSLYSGALEKFQQLDNQAGIANTHLALGSLVDRTAGLEVARPHYEQALALYEQIGDREGRDECLRRLDRVEKLDPPSQLFLSNLPVIETIALHLCQRSQLTREDAEDFISFLKLKLIEDDYAVFRKFKGRTSIRTYLSVVINHIFKDYRNPIGGKWRSSAEASRIGRFAIEWEILRFRDGLSVDEAFAIFQWRHGNTYSREKLVALEEHLPLRHPPRRYVGEEELLHHSQREPAPDRELLQKELQEQHDHALAALRKALEELSKEDRLIIEMYRDGLRAHEIARTLRMDQKPLYRKINRIFEELRLRLEKQGFSEKQIWPLIEVRGDSDP